MSEAAWHFFRAGEPAHLTEPNGPVMLLTRCGLSFHRDCARPFARGKKCANCRRGLRGKIKVARGGAEARSTEGTAW